MESAASAAIAVRTLDLGQYRRARVWIGELPDAFYPSARTLIHSVTADATLRNGSRLAAVELFVGLGARFLYGLLGGRFAPGRTDCLDVEVSIAAEIGQLFPDHIGMTGDEVRVGLPVEYAQAVMTGVDLAKKDLRMVRAGTLSVNCAAHGTLGSCNAVYKHLAAILVKVLNLSPRDLTDAVLIELFPTTFD